MEKRRHDRIALKDVGGAPTHRRSAWEVVNLSAQRTDADNGRSIEIETLYQVRDVLQAARMGGAAHLPPGDCAVEDRRRPTRHLGGSANQSTSTRNRKHEAKSKRQPWRPTTERFSAIAHRCPAGFANKRLNEAQNDPRRTETAPATTEELTKLTVRLDTTNVTGIGSALDNPYRMVR